MAATAAGAAAASLAPSAASGNRAAPDASGLRESPRSQDELDGRVATSALVGSDRPRSGSQASTSAAYDDTSRRPQPQRSGSQAGQAAVRGGGGGGEVPSLRLFSAPGTAGELQGVVGRHSYRDSKPRAAFPAPLPDLPDPPSSTTAPSPLHPDDSSTQPSTSLRGHSSAPADLQAHGRDSSGQARQRTAPRSQPTSGSAGGPAADDSSNGSPRRPPSAAAAAQPLPVDWRQAVAAAPPDKAKNQDQQPSTSQQGSSAPPFAEPHCGAAGPDPGTRGGGWASPSASPPAAQPAPPPSSSHDSSLSEQPPASRTWRSRNSRRRRNNEVRPDVPPPDVSASSEPRPSARAFAAVPLPPSPLVAEAAEIQARAFTIRINSCADWRPLAAMLEGDEGQRLDDRHFSKMLGRLPALTGGSAERAAEELLERVRRDAFARRLIALSCRHMDGWGPREVTDAVWGLARAGYAPDAVWLSGFRAATIRALPDMDERHVALVLWSLARLGLAEREPWLRQLVTRAGALLSVSSPQGLCMVLWAVAKLGLQPSPMWLLRVLDVLQPQLVHCSSRQLSNALWALATLRFTPTPEFLECLLAQCAVRWETFSPQALANLLWALGRLQLPPPADWLSAWLHHFTAQLPHAEPRHLSTSLWALAVLSRGSSTIGQDVGGSGRLEEEEESGQDGVWQDLAHRPAATAGAASAAAAGAAAAPPPLVTSSSWPASTSSEAAPLQGAWPSSSSSPSSSAPASQAASTAVAAVASAAAQQAVPALSSLPGPPAAPELPPPLESAAARPPPRATLVAVPAAFIDAVLTTALAQLPAFSPQALSNLLWALARLRLAGARGAAGPVQDFWARAASAGPFPTAVDPGARGVPGPPLPATQVQQLEARGVRVRAVRPPLSLEEAAAAAQLITSAEGSVQQPGAGAAASQLPGPGALRWLTSCSDQALATIPDALPQSVSMTVWSLARLGYRPSQPWRRAFQDRTVAMLPTFRPQALANTALALASMRVRIKVWWRVAFFKASLPQLSRFSPRELASTLWALSRLAIPRDSTRPGYGAAPKQWLEDAEGAMHRALPQATSGDIAIALYSLTRYRHVASDAFLGDALRRFVALGGGGRGRSTLDVANTLWALAMFRYPVDAALMPGLLAGTEQDLSSCRPEELAQLVWAMASMSHQPPESWLRRLEAVIAQRIGELSNKSAKTLLVSLAQLGYRPSEEWLDAVYARFQDTFAAMSARLSDRRSASILSAVEGALETFRYRQPPAPSSAWPGQSPPSSDWPRSGGSGSSDGPPLPAAAGGPTTSQSATAAVAPGRSETRPLPRPLPTSGGTGDALLAGLMAVAAGAAAAVTGPLF